MTDPSVFPDPVYKDTVLAPLFDHARDDHAEGFRRIDRAHLVMLERTGILPRDVAGEIARALLAIDAEIDPESLRLILMAWPDSKECCQKLVKAAYERGGKDNVTVMVVDIP